MKKVNRIGAKSLAKVLGLLHASMGFIGGILILIITLATGEQVQGSGLERILFSVGAPIFLTIFYALIGIIFGFVTAWIYNLIAKWIGGIELDLE